MGAKKDAMKSEAQLNCTETKRLPEAPVQLGFVLEYRVNSQQFWISWFPRSSF